MHTEAAGEIVGDPTEVALVVAARDAGGEKQDLEKEYPRIAELPFDSDRKCMTTLHQTPEGGVVSYTKGAVEVVLERSRDVATSSGTVPLDVRDLATVSERMAADGLRVLAVGMRRWSALVDDVTPEAVEHGLTLLGLVGLVDPPRPEVQEAVEMCKSAGVVPVMITGDHPMTARAIARRLGILGEGGAALTGAELATMSAEELRARVETIQERTFRLRNLAMDALVALIDDIKAARSAGAADTELAAARDFQRKAQFSLDFIEAENSMGFHASQEAARILAESLDFVRQGQVALRGLARAGD